MKKQLFGAALAAAILLMSSCGGTASTATTETAANTATSTETAVATETEVITEAATTEAPVRYTHTYIDLSTGEGTRNPISLQAKGSSVAVHVNIEDGWLSEISVACPSWSDNDGTLVFSLYQWNTDYDTTVAGTPVATESFVDYEDNDTLTVTYADGDNQGFDAGEYLFVISGVETNTSEVGIWSYDYPTEESQIVEFFKNGTVQSSYGFDGSMTVTHQG